LIVSASSLEYWYNVTVQSEISSSTILMSSIYILVGKPEGKRPLGRPMHRWEDNIRIDLGEIE
jgi:hypothetical protein